jgi:mycofactocin precursor
MPQPMTEPRLTSAEIEVDAEFVEAAELEPVAGDELLVEDVAIDDGMCGVY